MLLISRLFIGHHAVIWFPLVSFRNHQGSTFTEKDRNRLNYRIGPRRSDSVIKLVSDLITESDQAVRAVHSCNSWLTTIINHKYIKHFHGYDGMFYVCYVLDITASVTELFSVGFQLYECANERLGGGVHFLCVSFIPYFPIYDTF